MSFGRAADSPARRGRLGFDDFAEGGRDDARWAWSINMDSIASICRSLPFENSVYLESQQSALRFRKDRLND